MRQAPEPPPDFANITPASILEITQHTLENGKRLHADIVATVSIETASFDNVIRPIVDEANRASCSLQMVGGLLSAVAPDAALRNASREAEKLTSAAQDSALLRRDIAALVDAAYTREIEHEARGCSQLDQEDRHVLRMLHGQYARAGSTLQDEAKVEHLRRLRSELKQICLDAVQTMSDAEDGMSFSRDGLSGLSPESLAKLQTSRPTDDETQESLWVSFRTSSSIPSNTTSSSTRKKYHIAWDRRFPDNVDRLQRAVTLRDAIARLLGFDNHAELKSQDMMSTSVSDTISTLEEMERRLRPLRDQEINDMLRLKQRGDVGEHDDPSTIYAWDWSFYAKQIRQANYMLDKSELAEYFEVENTLSQMLHLFEKLFGMEFKAVETSVWHDSVGAYEVWNSLDEGGDFLGWFYTDVFNRQGKRQNAFHYRIRPGFVEADGTRHYPASALICNFEPPSASKPSLLAHSEVTLMFHELGHAIHNLVSRTKYAIPHSRDYIEIPSLMLEHWTWNADVLVTIGRLYTCLGQKDVCSQEDTTAIEPNIGALPRDLAEKVASTKQLHGAHQMAILIQRALFDLSIHSPTTHEDVLKMNTTEIWNTTRSEIVGLALGDKPGEESLAHASFGHLFRQYDAGFFAYAMSKAWSEDLYKHGFAGRPLDVPAARRYRRLVLEPGSSIPEREILENFLGRKLSLDAFYATFSRDC